MKLKKLSLFVLAACYCIIAQSQNVPITENGSVVYVTDKNKGFSIGDTTAKTRLRLKNLEIAQDSTGPGQGQGHGVGLLKKSYWPLLIDKEGDVFRSKEKFKLTGPPGFAGAGGGCTPVVTDAWQENNGFKLYLCQKYLTLGIGTRDPLKSLHIKSFHLKIHGDPVPPSSPDKSSHQGIRLEHFLLPTGPSDPTIDSSKWDLEPIIGSIARFYIRVPGKTPALTLTELGQVGINTTTPNTSLSITPSEFGAKITLWDGGSLTNHYGFGVTKKVSVNGAALKRQLNYHVDDVLSSHVFYAGGKNGDGTELMRIKGNGQVGIGENLVVPIGFRFGVAGSGYFSDKLAVGATTVGIARTYIQNDGTNVGLYVGNGTPFGQAKIELDGPAATHLWIAENGTRVFSVTAGGKVRIRVNNDNDIAFAVYKGNTENFRITGDGRFFARSYRIKLGSFPDYVFSDSYKRMTLAQKALYFKKYRHLPGLEPAEKYVKDGLDVGNTLVGLTTNVEENSLDLIDMDKRITKLEKENQELKEENNLLKVKNKRAKIIKIGFIEIRF